MDAELYQAFLKQAQKGDHFRRLIATEEWKKMEELFDSFISRFDTVRGIETDKEWLVRKSKVNALEELRGTIHSLAAETTAALEELSQPEEES
jgi:hypothetical protein